MSGRAALAGNAGGDAAGGLLVLPLAVEVGARAACAKRFQSGSADFRPRSRAARAAEGGRGCRIGGIEAKM